MLRTDAGLCGEGGARFSARAGRQRIPRRRSTDPAGGRARLTVAYHSACSLQHGQKVTREPKDLLSKRGFVVKDVPEGHLCCGSAGTYNILQPELAKACATARSPISKARAGCDRGRQHRLHHADRRRHRHSGRAHGRAARLGDRRTGARRAYGCGGSQTQSAS